MKKVLILLAIIVAVFLGYIARQPAEYTVAREVTMSAPAPKIFPYINSSKKMNEWNPWLKMDPKAKIEFSGPEAGVGAKTSWEGGDQIGAGSATVVESVPNTSVKTQLDYTKPWAMSQTAEMTLTPGVNSTTVRWSISGNNNFLMRIMCMAMGGEKMIGDTFNSGLNSLKTMVEQP